MPLIACPECGKSISDQAPACIGCGCPMDVVPEMTPIPPSAPSSPPADPIKPQFAQTVDKRVYPGSDSPQVVSMVAKARWPRRPKIGAIAVEAVVVIGLGALYLSGSFGKWFSGTRRLVDVGSSTPAATPNRTVDAIHLVNGQFVDDHDPDTSILTLTVTSAGEFTYVTAPGDALRRIAVRLGRPAPSVQTCTGRSSLNNTAMVVVTLRCDDGSTLPGERFQFDEAADAWRLHEDNNVFVFRRLRRGTQTADDRLPNNPVSPTAPAAPDVAANAPQNDADLVSGYRKAAEAGDSVAQFNLGNMYYDGRGVLKNDVEAASWYRKAADKGEPDAQNALGMMYHNGTGVSKSDVAAVSWFRKAADQGFMKAQYNLAVAYLDAGGVAPDDVEAYKWFTLAETSHDTTVSHPATTRKAALVGRMTQEQIARSLQLASQWKSTSKP